MSRLKRQKPTQEFVNKLIAYHIKAYAIKTNRQLKDIAAQAGICTQVVSRLCRTDKKEGPYNPSLKMLINLAHATDLNFNKILRGRIK